MKLLKATAIFSLLSMKLLYGTVTVSEKDIFHDAIDDDYDEFSDAIDGDDVKFYDAKLTHTELSLEEHKVEYCRICDLSYTAQGGCFGLVTPAHPQFVKFQECLNVCGNPCKDEKKTTCVPGNCAAGCKVYSTDDYGTIFENVPLDTQGRGQCKAIQRADGTQCFYTINNNNYPCYEKENWYPFIKEFITYELVKEVPGADHLLEEYKKLDELRRKEANADLFAADGCVKELRKYFQKLMDLEKQRLQLIERKEEAGADANAIQKEIEEISATKIKLGKEIAVALAERKVREKLNKQFTIKANDRIEKVAGVVVLASLLNEYVPKIRDGIKTGIQTIWNNVKNYIADTWNHVIGKKDAITENAGQSDQNVTENPAPIVQTVQNANDKKDAIIATAAGQTGEKENAEPTDESDRSGKVNENQEAVKKENGEARNDGQILRDLSRNNPATASVDNENLE